MKLILTTLFFTLAYMQGGAQVLSRMISHAFYSYNNNGLFIPGDSDEYVYDNPGYGGDLNHTMRYASDTTLQPLGNPDFMYTNLKLQSFDADTNIIKIAQYLWENDSFVLNTIDYYAYDGQLNELSDSEIANGSNYRYTLYTYDGTGNLLTELEYKWNSDSSEWENYFMINNTYDNRGNQLTYNSFWWGENPYQWDGYYTDSMAYNQANLMTESIFGAMSCGILNNATKTIYVYNNLNELQSDTVWLLNDTGVWVNDYRDVYTYNSNHQTLTDTLYSWNDSIYFHAQSSEWTYNTDGQVIFRQDIDFTSDTTWAGVRKVSYNYNEYGQLLTDFVIDWNTPQNTWYTYPYTSADFYRYEQVPTGIPLLSESPVIRVFPNPASSFFNLSVDLGETEDYKIDIINSQGKHIKSWSVNNSQSFLRTIMTTGWAADTYFIVISGGKNTYTKSLVVK